MKNSPTITGWVGEDSAGESILLVKDIKEYNRSKNHMDAIRVEIPWYSPKKQFKAGQKVKVYYNGTVKLSGPGRAEAYWISVMDD